MKRIVIIFISFFLLASGVKTQNITYKTIENSIINLGEVQNNNEDFSDFSALKPLLKNVEIVMLGEQSHGEATTYETKIKLIKYLHQELGFDFLVFESGLYECKKAWELIEQGENVRDAMSKSIFTIWSTTKELKPLATYLEQAKNSGNPLKLYGFDNQLTGKYAAEYFLKDLAAHLQQTLPTVLTTNEWAHFSENISFLTSYDFKKFKKNNPEQDLPFILNLIDKLGEQATDFTAESWVQILKSTHTHLSDAATNTDLRDQQMAANLIWIKEKFPSSKIICWGATSHFLYNAEKVRMKSPIIQVLAANYYKKQPMMGTYIKNEFQEKVYTIGFTAHQGEYGFFRRSKIKPPKKGTLEFFLGQSQHNNFLLPLKDLNLDGYLSRPLGNFYMKNAINEVMDAVIFNRYMKRPRLDNNLFLKIYPENKYIKPEVEVAE